ncbi:MAG: micrococcal nuclease [Candidatus Paceibacteria bacterium]|jgi:micrococcal nuclease
MEEVEINYSPATSIKAEVVRVIDGDTIVVLITNKEQTIRYIGIDTPEPYRDAEPACFSLEASLKNRELVEGKIVRLESDRENTDRYGRLLRYVYVDDIFVNAELIKEGYAKDMAIKPNTVHKNLFATLEQAARKQGVGLWGSCS